MNALDKLSEVTGIKKPEMDEILQRVKANQKTLEGCACHDFSICLDRHTRQPIENPTPLQRFGCKWKCVRCGGIVDTTDKSWYERGLKHGKI